MEKIKCTGQTCVGDLRLSDLDIGFSLRASRTKVRLPVQFSSVGLTDRFGETWLAIGTRIEMIEAIIAAGIGIAEQP